MSGFKLNRLDWREGFSVGIPRIDDEHRAMIETMNEIGDAMERNDAVGCDGIFGRFLDISRRHFLSEERVLFASGYPKAGEHAHRHRQLLEMAESSREHCRQLMQSRKMTECFNTLLEFLIGDLLEADIQFKSFLEELDATQLSRLCKEPA